VTLPAPSPRPAGCLSDLELDELLAGDLLGDPRGARLRTHVDGCARCRDRLASFAAVVPPPPPALPPELARAAPPAKSRAMWLVTATFAAAAAATVLVVSTARQPGPNSTAPAAPDDERTKGALGLTVFVKHAGGNVVDSVTGEGRLRAGDEIRFALAASRPGYAVVIGLDATPAATLYVPTAPAAGPVRVAGGPTTLPGSIVADATPGVERIVAVVCATETAPELLRQRAQAALASAGGDPARVPTLGTGCNESSVLLHKEPRP
jgi:hypothetical protein